MKTNFIRSLFIAFLMSLFSAGMVRAHGEPAITLAPTVAVPGESIFITGSDWQDGEILKITLESASGVSKLGQATASGNGDESGFTATYTLPTELAPGFYLVRCVAGDGHTATTDLTIVASPAQMNAQPMEASAEPMVLDRSKSSLLIASVILLALISAGLGVWLVRMHA